MTRDVDGRIADAEILTVQGRIVGLMMVIIVIFVIVVLRVVRVHTKRGEMGRVRKRTTRFSE
jgi:hypothetical protein